jgi:hypothetical protein
MTTIPGSRLMRLQRLAVNTHKWLALVIGVQVLLWIAGGVVMSVLPIEQVRGEHKIAPSPDPSFDVPAPIDLAGAFSASGLDTLDRATLTRAAPGLVWRLRSAQHEVTVDALTGRVLSPFDAQAARRIAEADYAGPGAVLDVEHLKQAPDEYGGPAPVWRVRFDDRDATTLYVDPDSGRVRARRSTTWRFYDLFWRLHVMDYDDGADFNHPLLIAASAIALLVAVSGLVLLVLRMRRSLQVQRGIRRRRRARMEAGRANNVTAGSDP